MADPRMEAVEEANVVFVEAGAQFDTAWTDLVRAADAESLAQIGRLRAYTVATRSGFVLESILDPERVTYFAGYEAEIDGDQIHPQLDEAHVESLTGMFAHNVEVIIPTGDRIDSQRWRTQPSSTGSVGSLWFNVEGIHANAEVPGLDVTAQSALKTSYTRYFAGIEAIQWRLPTEQEIAKFGNTK